MSKTATERPQKEKKSWADAEDEEDTEIPQAEPEETVEVVNGQKIKTVVIYKKNEEGKTVKVTTKYKQGIRRIRNNPSVALRRTWKKFGLCANAPPGLEKGITDISAEDVPLVLGAHNVKQEEAPKESTVPANMECRACKKKGDHYTANCPLKDAVRAQQQNEVEEAKEEPAKAGVYRPPNKRGLTSGDDKYDSSHRDREELPTLRVSNLSESAHEQDLQELFKPFGHVQRVFIAKDKVTMESRGFGFVTYYEKKDAQRALKHLDGYGYDHLILHLEWALPSKK